jgi:hypothetical protein
LQFFLVLSTYLSFPALRQLPLNFCKSFTLPAHCLADLLELLRIVRVVLLKQFPPIRQLAGERHVVSGALAHTSVTKEAAVREVLGG